MISALRASTYLMGAMLGRFGRAYVQDFGGCNFSARPVDMHIYAAECLGAKREGDLLLAPMGLRAAVISFDKVSVGATVNALLMATAAKGKTVIENAAREPHVENLIAFLRSMGAKIFSLGSALVVEGGNLHGGRIAVVGDMIEGGTYLLAGLCTGGSVTVEGCETEHLSSLLSHLSDCGASVRKTAKTVCVSGALRKPLLLKTAPYPGFPTDLQPQCAATCAAFFGGAITESIFKERFGYLRALEKMGVCYQQGGGTAYIFPSCLRPAAVTAEDLRGGAAVLLTALAAQGESEIYGVQCILRGYENVIEKLSLLGASLRTDAQ
jgi:UDP-N-acetylglucosamine 1-carboxyvinyltransferase